MGERRGASLPICDRCLHFVVRESGLSTCEPCRKLWQLQVSLRGVLGPKRDEQALVFLQECFSLLEEWVAKVKELETAEATEEQRRRGGRERSPLKRREEPKESRPGPSQEKPAPSVPPKAPPVEPPSKPEKAMRLCLVG